MNPIQSKYWDDGLDSSAETDNHCWRRQCLWWEADDDAADNQDGDRLKICVEIVSRLSRWELQSGQATHPVIISPSASWLKVVSLWLPAYHNFPQSSSAECSRAAADTGKFLHRQGGKSQSWEVCHRGKTCTTCHKERHLSPVTLTYQQASVIKVNKRKNLGILDTWNLKVWFRVKHDIVLYIWGGRTR